MSENTNPPSSERPADVRPAILRLVEAIGARLRRPLATDQRDALAVTLAAATRASSPQPPVDEVAARRAARSRRLRRLTAAAAALVVIGGTAGVVMRAGDDLPVLVLADGGPQGMAAASGDSIESMRADVEPMIGWWEPTVFRFVLADGLRSEVTQATAWRLVPPADLRAAAATLAAALELPPPTPTEWDPASLLTQTSSGASLWVSASGDWYFGGPSDASVRWDCPTSVDGADLREPVECTPPEPPSNVPSRERARTLAEAFLARLGHADVRVVDVMADEWGAYVQTELVLPGAATSSGVYVGVGFGGDARVTWANGTLARPEALGDYPLIDLMAALARLEQDMNAWLDGDVPMPRPLPADDGNARSMVEPSDGDVPTTDGGVEGGVSGDGPVTILPVPDVPGDEQPEERSPDEAETPGAPDAPPDAPEVDVEPVERTVRIVAVELINSMVWTADGTVVLLPHYRLIDADGGWWFVIAVEDRYIQR